MCVSFKVKYKKLEDEEVLVRKRIKIGRIVPQRQGMAVIDSWEEGQAFRDITAKKADLAGRNVELKDQARELAKKRKAMERALKEGDKEKEDTTMGNEGAEASEGEGGLKPTFQRPKSVHKGGAGEEEVGEEESILKLKQHLLKTAALHLKKVEQDLIMKKYLLIYLDTSCVEFIVVYVVHQARSDSPRKTAI